MSRWRPPQQRGSNYITASGFEALTQENKALWEKRREVTLAVTAAAAEGDRSENAEYVYRKKQLREIDRRLRYLQKRLEELKIVDRLPDRLDRVYFGAWVAVIDQDANEFHYRIVGVDEFDSHQNYISMDSPVARALMSKTIDDEVRINIPNHFKLLTITAINYEKP